MGWGDFDTGPNPEVHSRTYNLPGPLIFRGVTIFLCRRRSGPLRPSTSFDTTRSVGVSPVVVPGVLLRTTVVPGACCPSGCTTLCRRVGVSCSRSLRRPWRGVRVQGRACGDYWGFSELPGLSVSDSERSGFRSTHTWYCEGSLEPVRWSCREGGGSSPGFRSKVGLCLRPLRCRLSGIPSRSAQDRVLFPRPTGARERTVFLHSERSKLLGVFKDFRFVAGTRPLRSGSWVCPVK